jgi:hypothetical protein
MAIDSTLDQVSGNLIGVLEVGGAELKAHNS